MNWLRKHWPAFETFSEARGDLAVGIACAIVGVVLLSVPLLR